MKKLAQILLGVIFAFLLVACSQESVDSYGDIEPTEKTMMWAGYTGTMEGYEYYYTDTRNRAWEEDIVSLSEKFIAYHPKLVDAETQMIVEEISFDWQNHYDKEVYSVFLDGVNQLIPQISNLSDEEVLMQIQKIVACLDDAHSKIGIPIDPFFPLELLEFYTNSGIEIRAVTVPAEQKELIFAKLVSINNIPIEDVLEKIYPFLSFENEYWAMYQCTHDTGNAWLTNRDLLRACGVVDKDRDIASFAFQTDSGESIIAELSAVSLEEYQTIEKVNFNEYRIYSLLYKSFGSKNYWYQMMPEEDALYIRIARFYEDNDISLLEMSEQIIDVIDETDGVGKVIVDLRNNIGGSRIEGYNRFFQALSLRKIDKVYVLIDSGTFSRGVMAAHRIRKEIKDVLIVGTPAASGSFIFVHTENSYHTMPNCQIDYYIGARKDIVDPDVQYAAFMPDVLIYPTIEEYQNGVDSILNYVLSLP